MGAYCTVIPAFLYRGIRSTIPVPAVGEAVTKKRPHRINHS